MKITLLHISDGYQHFDTAIQTYITRLARSVEIRTIRPVRHTRPDYIRREETKKIREILEKHKGIIYLCDER